LSVHLPTLNAVLNSVSALLLCAGYLAIRRGRRELHKRLMILAVIAIAFAAIFRMQALGLKAKAAKKYQATTQSKHSLPVAPNLLEQGFTAPVANPKGVSYITDIWTEEGWLYLAAVLDLYSRAVVGWAMAERMTRELVIAALTMAVWRRRPGRGLIVHSDRGSQYASRDYQKVLEHHGLRCSMSRKGDCDDHAAMERFFHSLKVEQLNDCRYQTQEDTKAGVFGDIEAIKTRFAGIPP